VVPQQATLEEQHTDVFVALQHFCVLEQVSVPHLSAGAPRAREALPKPKEAKMPPPTTPVSSRKAWRRGIGLAIIRDTSSINALISLLLLTTPAVTEER
jgi:hypothetical protein